MQKQIKTNYHNLLVDSRIDTDFILLSIVAISLCVLGLAINNSVVVIGAMVISPLLKIILAVSSSIYWRDSKELLKALRNLLLIILFLQFISALLSLFIIQNIEESSLLAGVDNHPYIYFAIAVLSGIAGTFIYYWPNLSNTIAGIAIAVSLVPPIAISGITFVQGDFPSYISTIIFLLVNLVGILLGSQIILFFLSKLKKIQN